MRLTNVFSGRPLYYDRNPTTKDNNFDLQAVAPHAQTFRWTYTVPAGRKAYIVAVAARATRSTVAGTPGRFTVQSQLQKSGSGQAFNMYIDSIANTASAEVTDRGSGMVTLLAGDLAGQATSDLSTTGTVDYAGGMWTTEFDA